MIVKCKGTALRRKHTIFYHCLVLSMEQEKSFSLSEVEAKVNSDELKIK